MRILLPLLLAVLLPASAEFQLINQPGQKVNVAAKLVAGKQNLVVFHADSSPISRRLFGEYQALGERRQDLAVLVVNVNQLSSPVAKQYNITSLPSCKIYDGQGHLTMEGSAAYNQSVKWCTSGR